MTGPDLVRLLESKRYDTSSELEFQSSTQDVLAEAHVQYEREYRFNAKDRVDFWIEGEIALELKTKGSANSVARQLQRYAQVPEVKEIVLFSTRAQLCNMPRFLSGKPLWVALITPAI